jgi:hypothetical protein
MLSRGLAPKPPAAATAGANVHENVNDWDRLRSAYQKIL